MKITRIENLWGTAEIYLADLDGTKVEKALRDPEINSKLTNLGGKYGCYAGTYKTLPSLAFFVIARPIVAYGISVNNKYISFHKDYQMLAEEATQLVLEESLNKAVTEFEKSRKVSKT